MTTYLGKSCSFGLPRVPFRKLPSVFVFSYFPFGFESRMWDLIVSVPDHCLSFYFTYSAHFRVCKALISYFSISSRLESVYNGLSYQRY